MNLNFNKKIIYVMFTTIDVTSTSIFGVHILYWFFWCRPLLGIKNILYWYFKYLFNIF